MRVTRILAAAALLAATSAAATLTATSADAVTPSVVCDYKITASWPGGFAADLYIKNNGPAIVGWNSRWTMVHATSGLQGWSAMMTMPTPYEMTAANAPWNGTIPTGGTVAFGWTARAFATEVPNDITVNGTRCQ